MTTTCTFERHIIPLGHELCECGAVAQAAVAHTRTSPGGRAIELRFIELRETAVSQLSRQHPPRSDCPNAIECDDPLRCLLAGACQQR